MTPRERILTTLNHETPDRTPTDGWFHPEVMETLKSHCNTAHYNTAHCNTGDWDDVLAMLGIEGWSELSPHLVPADPAKQQVDRPGHASGAPAYWIDERTYEDVWGARFQMGDDGRYRRWMSGPLEKAETADDVARFRMLTTEEIREPGDYARQVAALKQDDRFVYTNLENPFRRLWNLRGFENALTDYLVNHDVLEAIYDTLFPLYTEMALRMTRAGVDMIRIIGDIAMQDRIMMGPEPWRRFDKPRTAALISACRAVNPDIVFFFHSDGNLLDVMDDLIEVGYTVINPIQPECMNPIDVKRRWGNHITMHGCISIQETLPFGTTEDVRREVEELIDHCGRDGGLILMPSNCIQPDTPIENIKACYHAARDFWLQGDK